MHTLNGTKVKVSHDGSPYIILSLQPSAANWCMAHLRSELRQMSLH